MRRAVTCLAALPTHRARAAFPCTIPPECGSVHLESAPRLVAKVERMLPTKTVAATTGPAGGSRLQTAPRCFCCSTQRQPDPSRAARFSRCRSHIKLNAQLIPSCRALKCHISARCIILTQASHSLPDEGIFSACARLLVCLSAGLWRLCTNPRTKERRSVRI